MWNDATQVEIKSLKRETIRLDQVTQRARRQVAQAMEGTEMNAGRREATVDRCGQRDARDVRAEAAAVLELLADPRPESERVIDRVVERMVDELA